MKSASDLTHLLTPCSQVSSGDFPHLLVSGPSGSGKRTRVVALLRELYGPGAERLRMERQTYETPSRRKVEVATIASNYHIEVRTKKIVLAFDFLFVLISKLFLT